MMNGIPFSQLGKIHQYATVEANTTDQRVFYLKIPDSCVGFIQRLASNWFTNTKYYFIIDGEVVERDIERVLGSMEEPATFNPPYLVKNYIEFKVDNNDSVEHTFEVLCDGFAVQKLRAPDVIIKGEKNGASHQ